MRQLKITRTVNANSDRSMPPNCDEHRKPNEEEIELIQKAKQGDTEAMNKIIDSNQSNLISIAKQYLNKGLSLEELIIEGKKDY